MIKKEVKKLVDFYKRQPLPMQEALKAFWRNIEDSDKPEAKLYSEALGIIHHEHK